MAQYIATPEGSNATNIASGANAALSGFMQGYRAVEDIQANREKRRQQAEVHDLQIQTGQEELVKLQQQVKQMQYSMFGSNLKTSLALAIKTGNYGGLNNLIQENPEIVKNFFGDVVKTEPLNTFSEDELKKLNVPEDIIGSKDLQKNFFVSVSSTGKRSVVDANLFGMITGSTEALYNAEANVTKAMQASKVNQIKGAALDDLIGQYQSGKIDSDQLIQSLNAIQTGRPTILTPTQRLDNAYQAYKQNPTLDNAVSVIQNQKNESSKSPEALAVLQNLSAEELRKTLNEGTPEQKSRLAYIANYAARDPEWNQRVKDLIKGEELSDKASNLLANMAVSPNGVPNAIQLTIDQIKSVLPESWFGNYSKEDLDRLYTKRGYQDIANVMLSAQFGATVPAHEMARFDAAFAKLTKNDTQVVQSLIQSLQGQRNRLIQMQRSKPQLFEIYNNGQYAKNLALIDEVIAKAQDNIKRINSGDTTSGSGDLGEIADYLSSQVNNKNTQNNQAPKSGSVFDKF